MNFLAILLTFITMQSPQSHGVAVVELFTSEGCSSCPPADDLLARLIDEARQKDQPVYALSFHVDYWNRLGWKDRFSDALYSRRQEQYASTLKLKGIYTPQMIVNGRAEFVGSDEGQAKRAIADAMAARATATVELKVRDGKIDYVVSGATQNAVLNLAVVERGLSTQVKRGENEGKQLRHENVVRWFQTIALDNEKELGGQIELPTLADVNLSNASIIAYVQDAKSLAVRGASGMQLSSK